MLIEGLSQRTTRVTDSAQRFLMRLKELGLVNELMVEEILDRLMVHPGPEIDVPLMKRVAAVVIFEHHFDSREDYFGIFDEEWRLLFT